MSILLKDVQRIDSIRDLILKEWVSYRSHFGGSPPEDLRSTFAASDKTGVLSHDAHKAIDVVTDSWNDRRYLFGFGIWFFKRHPESEVIFYHRTYQPHLHISFFKSFGKESTLSINNGSKRGGYTQFPRSVVVAKAKEITDKLSVLAKGYEGSVVIDWPHWTKVLEGTDKPWEVNLLLGGLGGSMFSNIFPLLKKYWWAGGIILILLVVVFFVKRERAD